MDLIKKINNKYEYIFYVTIFSIFISNFKIYVPLFMINILYVLYLIYIKEVDFKLFKWKKWTMIFMCWVLINTFLTTIFYKNSTDIQVMIKLFLNFSYLLAVSIMVDNNKLNISKKNLIRFLEFIIIINFLQVICIYFEGHLFDDFLKGSLTKSSDTAYIIGKYKNIIGVGNKNIWASKLTIFYLLYIYIIEEFDKVIKKVERISISCLGAITIILLLSRTSQLALVVPIIYLIIKELNKINYKYRFIIYSICIVLVVSVIVIFFNKFFHIKFDMTDGGFTRLYIWKQSAIEFCKKYFMIGGGIGSTKYFIQGTLGRFESNVHNIFLNIFFEFGLIGFCIYTKFLFEFFKKCFFRNKLFKNIFVIVIPMLIIVSLQYLGYDNDLMVFLIMLSIINKLENEQVIVEYV